MASVDPPIRVMAVVEWHPPAYKAGGPVRSVHNLVRLLEGTGKVELEVVTGAYELGVKLHWRTSRSMNRRSKTG